MDQTTKTNDMLVAKRPLSYRTSLSATVCYNLLYHKPIFLLANETEKDIPSSVQILYLREGRDCDQKLVGCVEMGAAVADLVTSLELKTLITA